MTSPRSTNPLTTLAAVAALAFASAAPALWTTLRGRVFVYRDLVEFFLPMKVYLHERLLLGDLPLWDPYTWCGRPFLANLQSQVLYPPNLAACLLPMPWAFGLFAAFHLAVAASGVWAWGRAWGLRPAVAWTAGVGFGLAGPLVAAIEVSNNLATMAWWPWVGWAACRLAATGSSRHFLALVLALLAAGLGGEPHLALGAGGLALGSAWLRPGAPERASSTWRSFAPILLAGTLAVGLSLVQTLPFLELLSGSDRARELTTAEAARHSVKPAEALDLLAPRRGAFRPDASGSPERGQTYLRLRYQSAVVLGALLLGLLPLLGNRRWARDLRRPALLASGVTLLAWLLALGAATPLFFLLKATGILYGFRYPAKFLLVASLGAALLAGIGLETLLRRRESESRAVGWLLGWPVFAATAALLATGELRFLHGIAFAAAGALVVSILPRPAWGGWLLAALVTADLIVAHVGVLPSAPAETLYEPTSITRATASSEERVYPRPTTLESLRSVWPEAADDPWPLYTRARVRQLAGNTPQALGVASVRGAAALRPRRLVELLAGADEEARLETVRLLGAGLFLSSTPLAHPGLEPVAEGPPHLYRVEDALPRTFLMDRWTLEPSPGWQAAASRGELVLLDREPAFPSTNATTDEPQSVLPGRAEPDRRSWHVSTPRPALFVVLEGWAPGWSAEVDGRPTPLLRANEAFRAVALGPGRHRVTMRYEPLSLRLGAAGSLLSLLLLVLLLAPIERRAAA